MQRYWFSLGVGAIVASVLLVPQQTQAQAQFAPSRTITTSDGYVYFEPGYTPFLTSINFPLTYGAYSAFPYGVPPLTTNTAVTTTAIEPVPRVATVAAAMPAASTLAPAPMPATVTATSNSASINIRVPATATVWLQGEKMNQAGTLRRFVSPALDPGMVYAYDVRATWLQNGKEVTQKKRLLVHAGDEASLSFLAPEEVPTPATLQSVR
jgi:uncharacterized protein (TIGR03000 family)